MYLVHMQCQYNPKQLALLRILLRIMIAPFRQSVIASSSILTKSNYILSYLKVFWPSNLASLVIKSGLVNKIAIRSRIIFYFYLFFYFLYKFTVKV